MNDLETFFLATGNNFLAFDVDICAQYLKLLVLMYADDTVIFAKSAEGLQKALCNLEKYWEKWELKVNCNKTK